MPGPPGLLYETYLTSGARPSPARFCRKSSRTASASGLSPCRGGPPFAYDCDHPRPPRWGRQVGGARWERTSWSCHHGVARWSAECPDATDGRWKGPLRAAFDRLASGLAQLERGIDRIATGADAGFVLPAFHGVQAPFEPQQGTELIIRAANLGGAAAAGLATGVASAGRYPVFSSAGSGRRNMAATMRR